MHIETNQLNASHRDEIVANAISMLEKEGCMFITPPRVEYTSSLPATVPSRVNFYQVDPDRFVEHSLKFPKLWEIYFGFVKPVQETHYRVVDGKFSKVLNQ